MKIVNRLTFLVMALAVICAVGPVSAQDQLPEMELRVTGVEDTPEIKPDTASEWQPLKPGRRLKPGDRIRTGKGEIVNLEVPAVTYSRITESSLIEVKELNRTEEERGLLTTETVVVNNIKLNEIRGKVQNSVKKHEGVATDYELQTPNAVAGVRGTDFQCQVTTFGQTKCAVLDGEVRFSSLKNPRASVTLGAGQQSQIGADEARPSEPSEISRETRRELERIQEQARTALQQPPTLSSIQLNGTSFENSISLAYSEPTSLTLSGQAQAPEEGARLTGVQVSVDGEEQSVQGLSEWSVTFEPEAPPAGEKRTLTVTLRAVDSNRNTSEERTLEITLVNRSGSTSGEGLPEGYREGQVDVEVTSIVGRSPDNVGFPLHLYRPDASEGGLTIQGTASGEASIENVAYSLDGGNTWQYATGAENWTIDLPAGQRGKVTVQIRAWTAAGVIGSPVEVGPINYKPISYEQAMRTTFEGFWEAFEREDPQKAVSYLHPDFQFQPPEDGPDEQETSGPRDRSGFQDFLRNQFGRMLNIRVFYSINTIFGNTNGGTLKAEPIEWEFKSLFGPENSYFPAATIDDASFKYRRNPSGEFKILAFQDFRPKFFIGFRDVVMGDTEGYTRGPAQSVFSNDRVSYDTQVAGWVIAGFNTNDSIWPGNPPRFYVNPKSSQYDQPHGWQSLGGRVVEGGIFRTPYTNFDQVQSIPRVTSTEYKNRAEMREDYVYAVNLEVNFGGDIMRISYLMQVLELKQTDSDPKLDRVRFRVINPGQEATTVFDGINPFD